MYDRDDLHAILARPIDDFVAANRPEKQKSRPRQLRSGMAQSRSFRQFTNGLVELVSESVRLGADVP